MDIDASASFYLFKAYEGEKILKTADQDKLHDWADGLFCEIQRRYHQTNEEYKKSAQGQTFWQSVGSFFRILPEKVGKRDKQEVSIPRKVKPLKRDLSKEFVAELAGIINAKMDTDLSVVVPAGSPDYTQALTMMKALLRRAFEIQMLPKSLWMISSIVSIIPFGISVFVIFITQTFAEIFFLLIFSLWTGMSLWNWLTKPSFTKIAGYVREKVYSQNS
ncbi:MAG TPA: hypothetical protein PKV16_03745 [Caldisericia bacterium]|nr:hypothetical protein [Caldisericia bacterium]HPF48424.1 hypothetical protein [Caldisericia bacterium]HPI83396.1 hypothetical protein [Caldisericia bacterium]HPQ92878.1 hypothetical protein [Caldisericia bacterium]HRV74024.1 hypothetical protein [Caldisericia bacterium]